MTDETNIEKPKIASLKGTFRQPPKEYQFKKGQSGNPNGLKKGSVQFRTHIKNIAEMEIDFKDLTNKKIKASAGKALIFQLFAKAIYKGDTAAAKILMEHAEGSKLQLGGDAKNPIKIQTTKKLDLSGMSDEELAVLEKLVSKDSTNNTK